MKLSKQSSGAHRCLSSLHTSHQLTAPIHRRYCSRTAIAPRAQQAQIRLQTFPASYDQAVRQAQEAVKAALLDGKTLLEIEFPTSGLDGVMGDGEGQNEMNLSMDYIRQFLGAFRDRAATTRVFFPDNEELQVAVEGQGSNPGAGRTARDPTFIVGDAWKLGYLTKQNAAWAIMGVNLEKFSPVNMVKPSDDLFVIAYPSFNPREELSATYELYQKVAEAKNIPIVIFNGELDRIRGGYYPPLFFSEIAKISRDFLPKFTQAYYIHNFKGSRPATLFRCYPGPWQVLRRNPLNSSDSRVIWTGDKMPSLREVQMEILPNAK